MSDSTIDNKGTNASHSGELQRSISWKGAFWVAAGVPALVLFSIGGIAATVGVPSSLVWAVSVCFGFLQAFVYAEIAGLFPNKSGGASVYGATAWLRYSKFIAPISVWCNWLAWTPVLSIGAGIAAGYILTALFPVDASIVTWQITLLDLSRLKEGLTIRINAISILGSAILVIVFFAQHRGISQLAKIQTTIAIAVLVPLLLIGIIPIFTGDILAVNFSPFAPIAYGADGSIIMDSSKWHWDLHGWTLFLGGMFIAAWSTYAFETAVCYTSEFKNPKTDTFKAIFYSGLLCMFAYILIPFSFQGVLGVKGMLAPGIVDGSGVAAAMAKMVGGGEFIGSIVVIMLIFALILAVMTSMAGSSRTLYQGSVDGWLPKYLSHVNHHGSPTYAMWTDLGFNLILLSMSDYLFVLAVSNFCYIIFNFLNLNAGWIHRIDNAHVVRPWRAPRFILAIGIVLSYVNLVFLGAGANVWGAGTLMTGLIVVALIIPVFCYRHFIQDGGRFPKGMLVDIEEKNVDSTKKHAHILPYITLVAGVIVVWVAHSIFS